MNGATTPQISAEVAEQAMQWLLELQEHDVSEATLAAWMTWRQAHPAHEHAWRRAEVFAQRMSEMRSPGQSTLARAALRPTASRRSALKQLSLLLAAGAGAWYLKDTALVQDWSADYHSNVGEQRRLALAADTDLQLNTDSAINVAFARDSRRIKLLRGEILITQQSLTEGRLLTVDSAKGRLESALAQFSVRQLAGLTQVSVYQGTLTLKPSLFAHQPLALKAGEQVSFNHQQIVTRQAVSPAAPAWSQGMLVAQGQRLAEFLEELSRYRRGHLACDPALADLRVSGTFPLDNTEKIILAVAETLQLDVQHFTRYWVTLKPRLA
ncbi:FecR family protein [Pseudomonas sp. BP8]|uniref:FecR domain-containing protein n=1 Tax=Pseudomonas sp. BP8 TaxID=2817864 RepID=UPI001AE6D8B3|nr:FecR family protein [Pseudomonas sp. BP8]MBP2261801.1 transmembrane sensor [Pseudomonas sp. BP8]HDS1736721.1 FecR family protein [Pseudomonas putida]